MNSNEEILTVPAGENNLRALAKLMVQKAQETGDAVEGELNNIRLQTRPGMSEQEICDQYDEKSNQELKLWLKTAEGQIAQREEAQRIADYQHKCDVLTADLNRLDFRNLTEVINWISEFTKASDQPGTQVDRQLIVKTFAENGFFAIADDFEVNENDRRSAALLIIGSTMRSLQESPWYIPNFVIIAAAQWKRKFGNSTA